MPFTVSHAAAVLPMGGRRLSASALVIGAMLPDAPLYLPTPFGLAMSHTVMGALTVNLMAGFVLFVIWHGFFARPADWFAPSAIRRRLTPAQQPGLRRRLNSSARISIVLLSLIVGQATHLLLDQFTHTGTLVTANVAFFRADIAGVPVPDLAQVALSVVGLMLMALWAVRWYRTASTVTLQREPSRLGKIAARATVMGGATLALLVTVSAMAGSPALQVVVQVAVATVVAAGVASILVAMVWHLNRGMADG